MFLHRYYLPTKKYLKEIAKFCKKHGTKLVLISTPSTKTGTTSDITLWKQFQRISVLIISIPIFSVMISRLIGKKDTKDKGDHLNYNGAVKMTNYIGKYLDDTKLFKDKRNDPSYDNWNTCLDKFEKQVKKGTSSEN